MSRNETLRCMAVSIAASQQLGHAHVADEVRLCEASVDGRLQVGWRPRGTLPAEVVERAA